MVIGLRHQPMRSTRWLCHHEDIRRFSATAREKIVGFLDVLDTLLKGAAVTVEHQLMLMRQTHGYWP